MEKKFISMRRNHKFKVWTKIIEHKSFYLVSNSAKFKVFWILKHPTFLVGEEAKNQNVSLLLDQYFFIFFSILRHPTFLEGEEANSKRSLLFCLRFFSAWKLNPLLLKVVSSLGILPCFFPTISRKDFNCK